MKKHLLTTLLLLFVGLPATGLTSYGQCVDCPQCGHEVAAGFLEKTKQQKNVYEVSSKEIAVPDICLPKPLFNLGDQLQKLFAKKCCPDQPCGQCEPQSCPKQVRSGKLKVVKVLSERSIKCARCEYQWEISDTEKVNDYLYQDYLYAPVETKNELGAATSEIDPTGKTAPSVADPKEALPGKSTLPLEEAPVIEAPPVKEVAPAVKELKKEVLKSASAENFFLPPAQPSFEY